MAVQSGNTTQVKLVLLGDSGVGKSSIVLRFVADNFKEDTDATIGASYMSKMLQIQEKAIKFNIWDTAGQERYHALAKMYYRDASAAILVYDITKRSSFAGLKTWYQELTANGPKNIGTLYSVIAIAGNKEDLAEREEIDMSEAKAYAQEIGALYRKTSAKTNFGVDQLFREIAGKINPDLKSPVPASVTSTRVGSATAQTSVQLKSGEQKRQSTGKCCK